MYLSQENLVKKKINSNIINAINEPKFQSAWLKYKSIYEPNKTTLYSDKISDITYDEIVGINTIVAAEIIPGIVIGITTLKKV